MDVQQSTKSAGCVSSNNDRVCHDAGPVMLRGGVVIGVCNRWGGVVSFV
jgi:hypothetical protein